MGLKLNILRVLFLLLLLIAIYFFFTSPTLAKVETEKVILTIENLEERLASPQSSQGNQIIDLTKLTIDLTEDNSEFKQQFYQKIQDKLNRADIPLGLDFSNSLIQGMLEVQQLGLQTYLSQDALPSNLNQVEQQKLANILNLPAYSQTAVPFVTLFRGVFKLNQAIITEGLNFSSSIFLQKIEAKQLQVTATVNCSNSYFAKVVNFSQAKFTKDINCSRNIFRDRLIFDRSQIQGSANFDNNIVYKNADFHGIELSSLATFKNNKWLKKADFESIDCQDICLFSNTDFLGYTSFKNGTFAKAVAFRNSFFQKTVNLEEVRILDLIDFSNTAFAQQANLDVAGLAFDSTQARLLGDSGSIGNKIAVPQLEGNENVLRNLVLNFRNLEQVGDANQIEYQREKLRLQQLNNQLKITNLREILLLSWWQNLCYWLSLSLLLLLSQYGTNFSLVLSVGMVAIAYFGVLYWSIDRYRRTIPTPIVPTAQETSWILGSYLLLTGISLVDILRTTDRPWLTLICLAIILFPIPLCLTWRLYRLGRYHDLMDVSYLVEDGERRQLRLLIVRLPIMPRFYFFRDRFLPLLWQKRWNWLNYYDFSLNNLLKFGFNDLRLRDEHLPGIISTIVWYQWTIGLFYIVLLLWTLSRTIPGLNLLLYL